MLWENEFLGNNKRSVLFGTLRLENDFLKTLKRPELVIEPDAFFQSFVQVK